MSGGKFKAGGVSPNPAGRPTKEESVRREFECLRNTFGLEGFEFDALVAAFVANQPRAISVVLELISRRGQADLLRAQAEALDDPDDEHIF